MNRDKMTLNSVTEQLRVTAKKPQVTGFSVTASNRLLGYSVTAKNRQVTAKNRSATGYSVTAKNPSVTGYSTRARANT